MRHTELKYERQEIQKSEKIKKSKGGKRKEICMGNEYEWVCNCLKLIVEHFICSNILYWSVISDQRYLGKPSITPRNKLEAKSLVCHGR